MKVKGKEPTFYFFGACGLIHRHRHLNQHFPNFNVHPGCLGACDLEDSGIVKLEVLPQGV